MKSIIAQIDVLPSGYNRVRTTLIRADDHYIDIFYTKENDTYHLTDLGETKGQNHWQDKENSWNSVISDYKLLESFNVTCKNNQLLWQGTDLETGINDLAQLCLLISSIDGHN